jgi:hypothetical protein
MQVYRPRPDLRQFGAPKPGDIDPGRGQPGAQAEVPRERCQWPSRQFAPSVQASVSAGKKG